MGCPPHQKRYHLEVKYHQFFSRESNYIFNLYKDSVKITNRLMIHIIQPKDGMGRTYLMETVVSMEDKIKGVFSKKVTSVDV